MAIKFNRSQTFATNGTVTAAGLHNLIDGTDIYQALITDQTAMTSVGSLDKLLIADSDLTAGDAPRSVTVNELFEDALTLSTYTNVNAVNLKYTSATGNYTLSTGATITNGTITNGTITNGTIASGTIPTLTAGTTTSTAANITNGTVQTLTASTGTIGTFNSTTGTIATLNSTTGTIATLNSTTGTIGNLSTTLAGDFTISQGTATLSTTGATAGTYGTSGIIPTISVDAKGRITTIGTSLGGKILQVVESSSTTPTTVASVTLTDTGLSGTITPTSSSSNILVMVYQNGISTRSGVAQGHATTIVRTIGTTSTSITTLNQGYESAYIAAGGATSTAIGGITSTVKLDSPGTTSLCTYKTQGRAHLVTSSGQVIFQDGNSNSRMILMEVAA